MASEAFVWFHQRSLKHLERPNQQDGEYFPWAKKADEPAASDIPVETEPAFESLAAQYYQDLFQMMRDHDVPAVVGDAIVKGYEEAIRIEKEIKDETIKQKRPGKRLKGRQLLPLHLLLPTRLLSSPSSFTVPKKKRTMATRSPSTVSRRSRSSRIS